MAKRVSLIAIMQEEALVFEVTREMRETNAALRATIEAQQQHIGRLEALVRAQVKSGCRCPDCRVWMDRARDELADTTEAPDVNQTE